MKRLLCGTKLVFKVSYMLKRTWLAVQDPSLVRNISLTLGRHIIAAVIQLLTVVMIARHLGPEGNGLYSLAVLVPSALVQLLNFGIGPATVFFVGRGIVSVRQANRENSSAAIPICILGMAVAWACIVVWGDNIFPQVPTNLLLIALLAFPLSLFQNFLSTILQGAEEFRAYNLILVIPPLVTLVGTCLAICFLSRVIEAILIAYVFGQVVGLCLVWRYVQRLIQAVSANQAEIIEISEYKRKLLTYGWRAYLTNIMAFLHYRIDVLVVNFFLNPLSTGLYVVAVHMAERLWILSQAASSVLFPRLSAMHEDPKARYTLSVNGGILVGVATLVGAGLLMPTVWFLIEPVFGAEFQGSLLPFLCLLPGVVVGSVSRIHSSCIAGAGKPEWNLYSSILIITLNFAGNCLLIPYYGITGAAISTTLANSVNVLVTLAMVRKTIFLK